MGLDARRITKRLSRIRNAWHFWSGLALVFTAQCFRLGGLRCSPLNAALGAPQTLELIEYD
ncbi:DUF3265 domain-containing protein [Vibrio parahaemolyticus]|nr:DUF3265 domain-containing protein [Vibrio parahaemolyticus]